MCERHEHKKYVELLKHLKQKATKIRAVVLKLCCYNLCSHGLFQLHIWFTKMLCIYFFFFLEYAMYCSILTTREVI